MAVFLLPMTVSGDGTATGLVQITLTYSLNVVIALISMTTLWLSCAQLSGEIEAYNIHMVVSKPCPRWLIWTGKWCGVFLMHIAIFAVSALIIFTLVHVRLRRGGFSTEEMTRLEMETLVGRRAFRPQPANLQEEVDKEYQARLARGEYATGHNQAEIKTQLSRTMWAKDGEVKPGAQKQWTFNNVRLSRKEDALFLRYRVYSGDASDTNQKNIPGLWGFLIPSQIDKVAAPFAWQDMMIPGGTFQEFPVQGAQVIDNNRQVVVRFVNLPQEAWGPVEATPAVFQLTDGPLLLCRVTGFAANYLRTMILGIFQIAFLAALGCTVGAAFSTPVAAFAAISYLVIGLSVQAAISAPMRNEDGSYQYKNMADKAAHKLAQAVSIVVVSIDDLDSTADLAKGRLVEYRRIGFAFLNLIVIRTGLIAGLGIWILSKRELGTVVRR